MCDRESGLDVKVTHNAVFRARCHHCDRMKSLTSKRTTALLAAAALLAALLSCSSRSKVPERESAAYIQAVNTFYVGLAALQVGDDVHAQDALAEFVKQAPGEPAGWGNWGVLALRQRNYDVAAERLQKAHDLAPTNDHIEYLQGLLESERGNSAAAIDHFRKAEELNPQNLHAAYALAQETERQGGANGEAEVQNTIEGILASHPDNLAALVESARVAAKRGDDKTLKSAVARISALSADWPPEAKQQLTELQTTMSSSGARAAGTRTVFLKNVLMRVPEYRLSLAALKAPPGDEAQPLTHLLKMESPPFEPAPPDTSISFSPEALPDGVPGHWEWIGSVPLGINGTPTAVVADAHKVHLTSGPTLAFPGGATNTPPSADGILGIDFNYDFKTDLVLAGAGGVRFFRQDSPSAFSDVTAATRLPRPVLDAKYLGAWAADIEADGDLDVVMGTPSGSPTVLRNNGDGTFAVIHPFSGVSGLTSFAWADLDGDGNPDASLIDGAGHLHVFTNLRTGQFKERPLPADLPEIKAIATADMNNDGILDLLAVQTDGKIIALSDKDDKSWNGITLVTVPDAANFLKDDVRLRVADLDNNGSLDLILARVSGTNAQNGALIWLGDGTGQFEPIHSQTASRVFDAADLNGDGRLDVLGINNDGSAQLAINHGSKHYHWEVIRPHAKQAAGDQRMNPFGVGGEIEVRSSLLVQKQPITGPLLHFGLGNQDRVNVARIVWPNGSVRAEFDLKADQEIVTEQRLKGSCPFLFAYNGKQVQFVKDAVPWSSAIGLKINTIGTARVEATEEWYKIGPNELAPHDGYYDLRFTAELWETYYYDYLNLMTVDHPAGTDIFVDERFVIPPAKLAITAVETPHPIARAMDDDGTDVTDILRDLDGNYLDTFGRGQYQGVTRDHYVEVDLGDDAPASGPLYLIAHGWMHPTDSSINVAIAQGHHEQAKGLSIEVPDGKGHWKVARPNLGFPAGRKKICLFDLTNLFRPGTPRKVRLRTNLEIYWDQMQWARGLSNVPLKIAHLSPGLADLHYRGYSVIKQANPSSPELPDYNHLEGTTQRYRDLTGYYTRYGDVRELLDKVDDRYVIMNSGDEMTLRFVEQPPPPSGWVRDYVIAGDGWIKDGDYNSTFSKTVLPLPYHAKNLYVTPPERLEDEWVYKHHPADWQTYQTRYVSDEVFENALRNAK